MGEQYECPADSWNNGHIDCGDGDCRCEVCYLQAKIADCKLKWTRKPPTEGGWYWARWRDLQDAPFEVVYVSRCGDGSFQFGNRSETGVSLTDFAGPIPKPEER